MSFPTGEGGRGRGYYCPERRALGLKNALPLEKEENLPENDTIFWVRNNSTQPGGRQTFELFNSLINFTPNRLILSTKN